MKNRNVMWLGPVSVLGFVVVLAIMYGWVGSVNSVGYENRERPDPPQAPELQTPEQDPAGNLAEPGDLQPPEQGGRLARHSRLPVGIGNNQIQLIDNTVISTGIGDTQIRLINQNRPGGPYLGLSMSELGEVVRKDLNIPVGTGVYVNGVVALSPAEKAGVKKGDVLLKCAHKPVNSPEAVGQILTGMKAGDVVKLLVNRDGKKNSFHAKLENAPLGLDTGATQNPVWMGADIQDVDAIMKIRFNLPDRRGVIVSHVAEGSPALAAGLRTGDVVRRFGEIRIRDVKQMQSLILAAQPGQQVNLTILRDGQHSTVEVFMERHLATGKVPFLGPADVAIEGSWIGMDVTELSAGDASGLGLPAGTTGILVNDVESPPATMVGFQTGDVIVAVNGQPTLDMKQFETATKEQSGAVVDVIRGNKHLFISVPPPGFTQQGTPLNGGMNKMRQVALTRPAAGKLGVLTAGPDLYSVVSGDLRSSPYLVLVDLANSSYAILEPNELNPLSHVLQELNVTSLVCSDISRDAANAMTSRGMMIYAGVTGQAMDAIRLYEGNQLVAMKGF
ncbi:MAG TPA: PDZ domain-containing protein [Deltaproteobacteria bacterium]|nr:PDZ domain-containing protein [Deltaproteobacteria bacterium]HIJ39643.1 PDZ domain-containing protein [Deltaproteobacteria bacterium]